MKMKLLPLKIFVILVTLNLFQSNSFAWDAAAVEGRKLWLKYNCYSCHGMRAAGGMGPRLAGGESDEVAEVLIEGGEKGMPKYNFKRYPISQADIANLQAYLGSIDLSRPSQANPSLNPREPYFMHWWETGTPTQ
jgi:mono/diheme cytochrome c family protein